ncbi:MAG: polysaccharide deacetylase family protein [Kineosporiaceae bacterium]|jgi:peptidoglycan/xylan/chitin deacetylase (PgdA/CDA1 family)
MKRLTAIAMAAAITVATVGHASDAQAAAPAAGLTAPSTFTSGGVLKVTATVTGLHGVTPVVRILTPANSQAACAFPQWTSTAHSATTSVCWVLPPVTVGGYPLRVEATVQGTVVHSAPRTVRLVEPPASDVSAQERRTILTCHRNTSAVALTFDDGGTAAQVTRIVTQLDRAKIRGRFFVRGDWARANPRLVTYITAHGHDIGNHTSSHRQLTAVSDATMRSEIARGAKATGQPRLFRPPYGAGAFTKRVNAAARAHGLKVCFWGVETRDWTGASAAALAAAVRYGNADTPPVFTGGVILLHIHGRNTAAALPGIIAAIKARGLTVETKS